jgi:hypothetical protein
LTMVFFDCMSIGSWTSSSMSGLHILIPCLRFFFVALGFHAAMPVSRGLRREGGLHNRRDVP